MNIENIKKDLEILSGEFIIETDSEAKYSTSEIVEALRGARDVCISVLAAEMPEKKNNVSSESEYNNIFANGWNAALDAMRLVIARDYVQKKNFIKNSMTKIEEYIFGTLPNSTLIFTNKKDLDKFKNALCDTIRTKLDETHE